MSNQASLPPHPHQSASQNTFTLDPLRTEGPDALPADENNGIAKVTLREIELAWNNDFHEIIVKKADDIFACAAETGTNRNPIPKGAKITCAALDFRFTGSPLPHVVHIRPPASVNIPVTCYAERIRVWLSKSLFAAAQRATALFALTVSILAAASSDPGLDDIDDDGDLGPSRCTRVLR